MTWFRFHAPFYVTLFFPDHWETSCWSRLCKPGERIIATGDYYALDKYPFPF